jgi:DNA-directed RNA polymerase specialized sigma24 family protein
VTRWSEDWEWWRTRSASFSAVASWQERHACLAGAKSPQDVLEACGADRMIPMELADRRLAAVVAEARTGDPVAARLALQRVFPGLVTRASHRASIHRRPIDGVLEELMASAWLVISEFPLDRRPVKIAVNIIRDAEYRLYGYVPVTARNTIPMQAEDLPQSLPPGVSHGSSFGGDPQDRLGEAPRMLLDAVQEGFPADDARLLAQLFVFDLTVTEIAAADGVSTRRVRARRKSALERLAAHIGYPPQDGAAGGGECA